MGISLTAGMRSNLYNLQQTSKLMEQTQVRLNTGKKVNSALDDPLSFFTARSHMSRSNELETLKNGMSEAIQTITAANDGISSMIALIEEAKSKAVSAKSAEDGTDGSTVSFDVEDLAQNDTLIIGGTTFRACDAGAAGQFLLNEGDGGADITALNLAQQINSISETDAAALGDVRAKVSGSTITIYSAGSTDITSAAITTGLDVTEKAASGDEKASLAEQYKTLISQLGELRDDASYKGINLMDATKKLTVSFEGDHKLEVQGFDGSTVNGLNLNQYAASADSNSAWGNDTDIQTDIDKLDAAVSYLEREASSLASSLSIVSTRQDFTQSMINNLTTGADNLTLADMNEEGANMLMLQTQQSLGSTSLSLAAQAAQSVLRLF